LSVAPDHNWPVPLIVYLDETGDHSLDSIDEDYPVFALVFMVADVDEYCSRIVPAVTALKLRHFGHDGVILHSSDIRRQRGDFAVLRVPSNREAFMVDAEQMIADLPCEIIAVVIRKKLHKSRYGSISKNPYELAVEYGMERLNSYLAESGQTDLVMIAEARGKAEDDSLRVAFFNLMQKGTAYHSFRHLNITLHFVRKERNVAGLQVADLLAYPIGRYAISHKATRPWVTVRSKFLQRPGWRPEDLPLKTKSPARQGPMPTTRAQSVVGLYATHNARSSRLLPFGYLVPGLAAPIVCATS
jgi:hypothetical protein